MATFLTLIEEVEGLLRRGTTLRDSVKRAIAAACVNYKTRRFDFNELSLTFSTVADQGDYDDSDNASIPRIARFDSVTISNGSAWKIPLAKISNDEIENAGVVSSGTPHSYAFIRNTLRLHPPPSSAGLTVKVEGVRELAAGTNVLDHETALTFPTASELDWFGPARLMIMSWAMGHIHMFVLRNTPEATTFFNAAEIEAGKLAGDAQARGGTDTLTATSF